MRRKSNHLIEDLELESESHRQSNFLAVFPTFLKFSYFGLVLDENDKLKEHNTQLFKTIDNLRTKVNKMEYELTSYKDQNSHLELKLSKPFP